MESIWLFTECVCVCVRLRSFIIFVWNMAVYCAFAYAHLAIKFRYLPQVYIPINIWLCAWVRTYVRACVTVYVFLFCNNKLCDIYANMRTSAKQKERERDRGRRRGWWSELVLICDANDWMLSITGHCSSFYQTRSTLIFFFGYQFFFGYSNDLTYSNKMYIHTGTNTTVANISPYVGIHNVKNWCELNHQHFLFGMEEEEEINK